MDATALVSQYRHGELSPVQVVTESLAKIDALNPQLHAFTAVFGETALAAAAEAETCYRSGRAHGALLGVPVGVKDLALTKEHPTYAGTSFLGSWLELRDAALVTLLRQQGAIVMGKTTMTEGAFSMHHPSVAAPLNPWAPDHWAGVSSSGSGVAVAARLVPLALGSDTGGSIRLPSACNRVVGHKPTFGAISCEGCVPLAPSLDHMGPLALTIDDCELLYRVMAEISAEAAVPRLQNRIGVDGTAIEKYCDPVVGDLMFAVIEQYRALGMEIVELTIPVAQAQLARGWLQSVASEAAEIHAPYREQHAQDYGPAFAFLLEHAETVGSESVSQLVHSARQFQCELDAALVGVDALLCPVMPSPAQSLTDMLSRQPSQEAIARSMMFTAPFNYSGHPAFTLPAGFINGVPAGYQLVGRRGDDLRLFELGRQHERSENWAATVPAFPGQAFLSSNS